MSSFVGLVSMAFPRSVAFESNKHMMYLLGCTENSAYTCVISLGPRASRYPELPLAGRWTQHYVVHGYSLSKPYYVKKITCPSNTKKNS